MSKTETVPLRVAIVDDHTFMREGTKLFVTSTPEFEWCWAAADAAEALAKVEEDLPDLLLVDISLPDRSGLELIKDLHAAHPDLAMIVLSMHEERIYAHRALKAGARGYLRKDAMHEEYEEALRKVGSGGVYVSEAVYEEIVLAYAGGGRPTGGDFDAALASLTDREIEIFRSIGEGRSTHEVASLLGISPKTVDVHKMNIRIKLGLEDGSAVVRRAIQWHEAKKLGG
jgi:DNA-binding NarL/FixJ family response regulator